MQIRLLDVAGEAQTLAASPNHSAFNVANAPGAWLGGIAIDAGLGWTSTGRLGSLLAISRIAIILVSAADGLASWIRGRSRKAVAVPVVAGQGGVAWVRPPWPTSPARPRRPGLNHQGFVVDANPVTRSIPQILNRQNKDRTWCILPIMSDITWRRLGQA